jgi:hypothetical protein
LVHEERKSTTKKTKKTTKKTATRNSMAGAHTLTMYDQLKPKSTLVNEPLRNQQLDVSRQSAASSRKGGKSAMKSGSKKQPAIRSSFNNA